MVEEKVKRQFVREVLEEQGKLLSEAHIRKMDMYKLHKTGEMESSLSMSMSVSGNGADGVLTEKHKIYQRFLDIKHKGILGAKRKRYPIHNKVIWGNFSSISYKLMYYMTEDVVARIKKEINI